MTAALLILAVVVLAMLAGRGKKGKKPAAPKQSGWVIGPTINGRNYSVGMPARPTLQGAGWWFDFPTNPASHVHYVQWFSPPALSGESLIRARFRVTGGGFVPQEFPDREATVSLMFQRKGDTWGEATEAFRWFSKEVRVLAEGEFEIVAPLTFDHWFSTFSRGREADFAGAIREVENIAVLFGSTGGRGHGVYATQPSRFTLISLEVE